MKKPILTGALLATAFAPIAAMAALEEVIVSAQRREQNLQVVPISVTAFDGSQLESSNIQEASQYLQFTPNVSYTEDGQTGSKGISIAMRGISNINTDESAFIQSIGIYLDEFSVASTANATINPGLLDLERVEVLRGPQGTYFGRNAVGGALNLTTKKPHDKFEGEISVGGQGWDTRGSQWDVHGIVNIPVSENFFIRASAQYEDNSGIIKNIVPGGGDSGHEYMTGRFAARWLASENTTVDAMVYYSDEEQGLDETVKTGVFDLDSVATFFINSPAGGAVTAAQDDGTGFFPNNQSKVAHSAIDERNDNRAVVGVLNISHQINDQWSVKSVTGIIDTNNEKVFDNDLVPEDLVRRYQEKNAQSWSEEIRFQWSTDRFDWVVGFLYAEDEVTRDPLEGTPGGGLGVVTGVTTAVDTLPALLPVPRGANPALGPILLPGVVDFAALGALPPLFDLSGGAAPGGVFLWQVAGGVGTPDGQPPLCLGCSTQRRELTSWAIFQDFTWHASDRLDLIFGFRYTEDEVDAEFQDFGLNRRERGPLVEGNHTFDDFAPRFSAGWQVTDDVRLYATVSKGYKAGGFTQEFSGVAGPINERFDKETIWNYEAGIKSMLLDNRLRLNLSGFYLEWSDLQLETFFFAIPGDATSNVQRTINVDKAEAAGFEVEMVAAPTDQFTVFGGIGYTDTEIKSSEIAQLSGNQFVNLEGRPLPRSPKWTLNLNGEYRWPWQNHELWARIEWAYRTGQFSTIEDITIEQTSGQPVFAVPGDPMSAIVAVIPVRTNFPFKSPSYHLVNIRAGVDWNENVSLNAFVANVFDEEYYTGTGENFGLAGFRVRPHPRFFGGSIVYRWE